MSTHIVEAHATELKDALVIALVIALDNFQKSMYGLCAEVEYLTIALDLLATQRNNLLIQLTDSQPQTK